MQEREYLRVKISGLMVNYDVLPEDGMAPLAMGLEKRDVSFPRESLRETLGENDAMQNLIVGYLQRIEAKLDRLIGSMERESSGKTYHFSGEVIDIGGGGLSMKTRENHPVGTVLDLCIFAAYGDPRPVFGLGRVCRMQESPGEEGKAPSYILGVEFTQLDEDDRRAIVRLVFQTERKQRQQSRAGEWY